MKSRTLFTAFTAAQAEGAPAKRVLPDLTDDTTLLNALRNSATDRDQIIRRRITVFDDITK
jgi:hypothetical protein